MSKDATDSLQSFSPYAQIVAALLPRAAGLSIFNPYGELRWTSDDVVPQLSDLIARAASLAELNEEPGERALLPSQEPVYLFWLRGEDRKPKAVACIRWRHAENDPRTFSYVHAMLRPVIECLGRELHLQAQLATAGIEGAPQPGAHDGEGENSDLQVLLSTSEEATSSGGGDIAQLLTQVNSHMGCDFTALLMPERNVLIVSKTTGCEINNTVLARAHRHLISVAQLGKEALLLNEPGSLPGLDLPLRAMVSAVRNPAGRVTAVLALFRKRAAPEFRRREGLLADLLARRAAAVIESRYDALTGLFARRAFEPRVRLLRAERPNSPWSIVYVDADRLHAVNDNHGMQVGDRLLVRVGELIRARLAPGGAAARMTGDRFAILLPAGEEDAAAFAEGLRVAIAALTPASLGASGDAELHSSLSAGVASIAVSDADPANALVAAEAACRAAKRHGRNRVERYAPGGDTSVVTTVANAGSPIDADAVRLILEGGHLCLHAQLIAPLPGNLRPTPHFELLLRVQDEAGNPTGPGRFLADARRLGLMSAVDRWVLHKTLALLAPRASLLQGGGVVLAVNLSGESLADPGFATGLLAQLRDSGIDPKALCFEFGEADVIAHPAQAEELMHGLQTLGCGIALEDFGTGTTSLANLRSLPVTMLKIDGSFVRGLLNDSRAEAMVQGLMHLGRSAGFACVAECVETDEIRMRLVGMGVDYAQGFAIAKPVPLDEAIRDLPTWVSVARQRQGGDIVLGEEDDTVSAALQKELQSELQAGGLLPAETEALLEATMARLFEEGAATTADAVRATENENPAGRLADLYPRQSAG